MSNKWPTMVADARNALGETQTVFGNRFGVSHAAVSDWESGKSEPPSEVTWWLMEQRDRTREYQRGFHDGFSKAFWFARKMEELDSQGKLWMFERELSNLIDERMAAPTTTAPATNTPTVAERK